MIEEGSVPFGAVLRGIEAELAECPALGYSRSEFQTNFGVERYAELLSYPTNSV
jgi:hypothetical protein